MLCNGTGNKRGCCVEERKGLGVGGWGMVEVCCLIQVFLAHRATFKKQQAICMAGQLGG